MLTISIITATLNQAPLLRQCIESVRAQSMQIEHIIVDGGSTDGSLDLISHFMSDASRGFHSDSQPPASPSKSPADLPITHHLSPIIRLISEPDNGIYDALNKGIRMASGDVIGFLHADDIYADNSVIAKVAEIMSKNNSDSCYGDLLYVNKNNTDRTIRYWRSGEFAPGLLRKGWMPPHPTFFVRRRMYEALGVFDTSFKIAADYELMVRFLGKHKISTCYIPEVLIKMRVGGASNRSIPNILRKSTEDLRIMRMHNIGGIPTLLRKNLSKLPQFFLKSKS